MRISLKEVYIHNFMSFSSAHIYLDTGGYIFVMGTNNCSIDNTLSNGSGKSSILESILWCLTGETSRGISGKSVLKQGTSEGYVKLIFSVDNDEYVVTRKMTK